MGFQEYRDRLDELDATVNFGGGTGSLSITVQTKREFLNETLDVVREALREPAFDADEFEIVKNEMVTQQESQQSEPNALAGVRFRQKMAPYPKDDVRYSHSIKESIELMKGVTIDDVKRLYKEFLNGEHGELAIVGDFDADSCLLYTSPSPRDS